jgi:penicillin-binding protein 1C
LTAYWVTDILADPDAREYIFGRGGSLELPFPVAVKTGTSQAYHDNWTIGYTRELTVGVWVGNFSRRPLRDSTGVTGAGPIFQAVMLTAARRVYATDHAVGERPIMPRPDSLREHEVCALSGMTANAWCPSARREWLPSPSLPCSWHHQSEDGLLVIWPPEYRQWARQTGLLRPAQLHLAVATSNTDARRPPWGGRTVHSPAAASAFEIASPPSGATFLIDPTLRREFQAVPLRVTTARPGPVEWQVNGESLGSTSSETPMMWALRPGLHTIVARDEQGRTAETRIVVR